MIKVSIYYKAKLKIRAEIYIFEGIKSVGTRSSNLQDGVCKLFYARILHPEITLLVTANSVYPANPPKC